ncbi:MAG: NADH-quinone oxidoreductase subunit N [Acidimicrobiales bacterium]
MNTLGLITAIHAQVAGGDPGQAPATSVVPHGNSGAGLTPDLPPLRLPHVEYHLLLPFLILVGSAVLLLGVSSLIRNKFPKGLYAGWTVVTGVVAMGWTWHLWGQVVGHSSNTHAFPRAAVAGALAVDGFALLTTLTICSALVLGALLAETYLVRERLDGPEFYVLAMMSAAGGVLMAEANDLIVVFLGLEILSLALYVLTAYHRRRAQSGEAGMKYFVLGAFSSAFFLYGVALTYGATGSTNLAAIAEFLSNNVLLSNGVLLAGMAFLLVGLGFKVSAVPFHVWTPDVYQGAPTPATGFMAAAAKAAGFAALLRIFLTALGTQTETWRPLVWVLAALTLVVGAVLAVVQTDVKRILAYSSVSHAGYVLLGLQAATAVGGISTNGLAGASFYLLAYTFMVAGSFAVVIVVSGEGDRRHSLAAYRGLAADRPLLALAFTILLISQAGIPFTSGFIAKFNVISAVVSHGGAADYVLGVVAMLAAVVSTYFYLRIILAMYDRADDAGGRTVAETAGSGDTLVATRTLVAVPTTLTVAIAICVAFTVVFGVIPGPMMHLAEKATLLF